MNTRRIPLLLASLLLAACSNVVITGGGSGQSSSSDGSIDMGGIGGGGVGTVPTVPAQPTFPAVALTRAQQDVLWAQWDSTHTQSGSSGGTGGGPVLDPNDLFLRVSDLGESCGSPTADLSCGGHWDLTLVLPSTLQQVGVYDLHDPELDKYSGMSEMDAPNSSDPNDCGGGGGSLFGDGTLEIVSIDATEVHFRVSMTNTLFDNNPSGDYTAPRCP